MERPGFRERGRERGEGEREGEVERKSKTDQGSIHDAYLQALPLGLAGPKHNLADYNFQQNEACEKHVALVLFV